MAQHILIIEDDKELSTAITDVLQHGGFRTSICTAYRDVFSCLEKNDIDLILMDGYLHEHDGRNLLQQLKSSPDFKEIPVVFASVMTEKDLANCMPDAILPKPYGMHQLLQVVNQQLLKS